MKHYCSDFETKEQAMIRYILSFIEVVKASSFSKAAVNSGISKAQLSRHVRKLEDELGIQLIHRTTRTFKLTESGAKFFEKCAYIHEEFLHAINNLENNYKALAGTVRITAPITWGSEIVLPLLNEFMRENPNIKLIYSLSDKCENLVDEDFDIALRVAKSLPDSNLQMRALLTYHYVVCASPEYLNDDVNPKSPQELKYHRCITTINREPAAISPRWEFIHNNKEIYAPVNSICSTNNIEVQIRLALAGAGIARVPYNLVRKYIESGELKQLFGDIPSPKYSLYLLYPQRASLPQKTRTLIDFLAKKFREV